MLSKEDRKVDGLRYSPDGGETADLEGDNDKAMLVIGSAETGEVTKSFNVPSDLETPWIL